MSSLTALPRRNLHRRFYSRPFVSRERRGDILSPSRFHMFRITLLSFTLLFLACNSDVPPTGPEAAGKTQARSVDRDALFAVYGVLADAAGRDIGFLKDGLWTSRSTIAKWEGVTVEDGRVVELFIRGSKRNKNAPVLQTPVFQELVQALSTLTELRQVVITSFKLPYDVTSSIEKWNEHFEAAHSRTWPAEIANLTKLESIHIPGQPLNFTGPATQLNSIKQATVSLPVDPSFWTMTQLEELSITSLRIARVAERTDPDKFLTWGWESQIEVPEEISQLQNLKKLRVGGRSKEVVVSLPETISQLTQLEELHIGPSTIQLPASLSTLTNLQHLHITGHGQLPASWSQLASLKVLRIVSPQYVLYADSNLYNDAGLTEYIDGEGYIHGPLPPEWGNLSNLESFSVTINQAGYLNGELPPEWSQLNKLHSISLANHEFEGSLPAEWGQLTQLKHLDLSNNLLEGSIPPEWCQMTALETLNLSGNSLSGSIPSQINDLTNLVRLGLANNRFSGSIPPSITRLKHLEILSLSNNELTGSLIDFSNMQFLKNLVLSENQLTGTVNGRYFPVSIEVIGIKENDLTNDGFPHLAHLFNLRAFSYDLHAFGPLGYTDVCPRLPPYLRENGGWACYHM